MASDSPASPHVLTQVFGEKLVMPITNEMVSSDSLAPLEAILVLFANPTDSACAAVSGCICL